MRHSETQEVATGHGRRAFSAALLVAALACAIMPSRAAAAEAAPPKTEAVMPVKAQQTDDAATLDNGLLAVRYDVKDRSVRIERKGKPFVTRAALWPEAVAGDVAVRIVDAKDALGTGKAIEVRSSGGAAETIALYVGLPFACLRVSVRNEKKDPLEFAQITPLAAAVDAGPLAGLRLLGCDGLAPAEKGKTSYSYLVLGSPESRAGVVCGWLTHWRGSGIVSAAAKDGAVSMEGRCEYGRLAVPPGGSADGEVLAIGFFDDVLAGLEAYADAIAAVHGIALGKVPSGYCTWYHAHALDQKRMAALAKFCRERRLMDFGLDFLQIDDGWQTAGRDYTAYKPRGPYSDGMKATADTVRAAGMTAGLWFIPFGWSAKAPSLAKHGDWFVHRKDGSIYSVSWAGDCLDMSHPEAREFLRGVVARMTREWGFKYLKIDGLWSGMAVKILYPSPAYRDDGLGDAVFHDPAKTNVEVYRDGLKLVREAAGKDVYILGCNIAQNMRTLGASFGLVDGMRVGADIGATWKSITGTAVPTAARFYFLNRRVWANDPDCLMLRDPLTVDQARAWGSMIALSGQLNVVSEWLPDLPPEKLDVVKRTMPNHGGCGRPIDLLDRDPARIWHLRAGQGELARNIVGLFNWSETRADRVSLDVTALGLPVGPDVQYVGFDFWENRFLPPFSGQWDFEVREGACRVLSIHRMLGRPQLVGTSRHVTQGLVDVAALAWDGAKNVLAGRSRVVAGDPYELRIVTDGYKAGAAAVSEGDRTAGVTAAGRPDSSNLRVLIASPETREVAWEVGFSKP